MQYNISFSVKYIYVRLRFHQQNLLFYVKYYKLFLDTDYWFCNTNALKTKKQTFIEHFQRTLNRSKRFHLCMFMLLNLNFFEILNIIFELLYINLKCILTVMFFFLTNTWYFLVFLVNQCNNSFIFSLHETWKI